LLTLLTADEGSRPGTRLAEAMGGALERFSARASPVLFITAEYQVSISAEAEEMLKTYSWLADHLLSTC
jgi:hypothetical protein